MSPSDQDHQNRDQWMYPGGGTKRHRNQGQDWRRGLPRHHYVYRECDASKRKDEQIRLQCHTTKSPPGRLSDPGIDSELVENPTQTEQDPQIQHQTPVHVALHRCRVDDAEDDEYQEDPNRDPRRRNTVIRLGCEARDERDEQCRASNLVSRNWSKELPLKGNSRAIYFGPKRWSKDHQNRNVN